MCPLTITTFKRGRQIRITFSTSTPLAPGMCFSDEPMIAIYGEFGTRLEDCLHVTDQGPKFFTEQAPSIDHLFA